MTQALPGEHGDCGPALGLRYVSGREHRKFLELCFDQTGPFREKSPVAFFDRTIVRVWVVGDEVGVDPVRQFLL